MQEGSLEELITHNHLSTKALKPLKTYSFTKHSYNSYSDILQPVTPLLEIVAGTAKSQNMVAADKFPCWTSDILAGDPHPTIQYKKGSLNLIADSLSRLSTGEHYNHDIPLHNTEPIILKEKAEVNMVTTHTKSAEQAQLTPKLPDLQTRVRNIFKTSDKCQLIKNAETVLDTLEPAKLRELLDQDQSIINLKNSRK